MYYFPGLSNSHTPVRPPSTSSTGSRGRWVLTLLVGFFPPFLLRKILNMYFNKKNITSKSYAYHSASPVTKLWSFLFLLYSHTFPPTLNYFETNLRHLIILLGLFQCISFEEFKKFIATEQLLHLRKIY